MGNANIVSNKDHWVLYHSDNSYNRYQIRFHSPGFENHVNLVNLPNPLDIPLVYLKLSEPVNDNQNHSDWMKNQNPYATPTELKRKSNFQLFMNTGLDRI